MKLFNKFFSEDIKYLLSMDKLWTKRTPPVPLSWDVLSVTCKEGVLQIIYSNLQVVSLVDLADGDCDAQGRDTIKDQRIWTPAVCVQVMASSIQELSARLKVNSKDYHTCPHDRHLKKNKFQF